MTEHLPPTPYRCSEDLRTEAVRDSATLNGIDYLEVRPGQTVLEVHFLHPLPGQTDGVPGGGTVLNRTHLVIEGGDRVRDLGVRTTSTSVDRLLVTVTTPGDFSTYRLRLVDPVTGAVPTGFDPRRSTVDFSFKAGCPIRFDCAPRPVRETAPTGLWVRDYLAKDYDSFRRLMLDRLAEAARDRGISGQHPADLQVTLVELLAYAADRLSYEQDAVATEAYLGTARRRVSVRRHARLLGYRMHEGCAARAFVHVTVEHPRLVEAGRIFCTGAPDDSETVAFQALHDLAAVPDHNSIALHTWTDEQCSLPVGATGVTLAGDPAPALAPGDFLLLEEIAGPDTGAPQDQNPEHRHVVRLTTVTSGNDPLDDTPVVEVTWSAEDALPFPLRVSAVTTVGSPRRVVVGVARGNIVLVEHGTPASPVVLDPDVDVAGRWRPRLPDGRPTYAVPSTTAFPPATGPLPSARVLLAVDPRLARPCVEVTDGDLVYSAVPDLLASPPEAPEFVVETEEDGTSTLRFGDGTYGRVPDPDIPHTATYRRGHGTIGNVASESITRIRPDDTAYLGVRNPLPATGGAEPEPTEQVRTSAPHAFREQQRAVTEEDYGAITASVVPGVQRAVGRLRWTGSWYTAFITVDREGAEPVDHAFGRQVQQELDGYRLAGVDVQVSAPQPVPLEIHLEVCASPDRFATDVERDVLAELSAQVLPDGRHGLFHPDNLTFGTSVHLSRVLASALAVPGVVSVHATRFGRYGKPDRGELAAGTIVVADREIAQLAGDPDLPERGVLTVTVGGAR